MTFLSPETPKHIKNIAMGTAFVFALAVAFLLSGAIKDASARNAPYDADMPFTQMAVRASGTTTSPAGGQEIWISEVGYYDQSGLAVAMDLNELYRNAESKAGFEFRSAEEFGYVCDVIVSAGSAGSLLELTVAAEPVIYITFWKQHLSGKVEVTVNSRSESIDLYTPVEGGENWSAIFESSSTPSAQNVNFSEATVTGLTLLVFFTLFVLFYSAVVFIYGESKRNGDRRASLLKCKKYLLICGTAFLMTITAMQPLNRIITQSLYRDIPLKITVQDVSGDGSISIAGYGCGDMDLHSAMGQPLYTAFKTENSPAKLDFLTKNVLTVTAENGASFVITGKESANFWLSVYRGSNGGTLLVEYDEHQTVYDLKSDVEFVTRIYPFTLNQMVSFKSCVYTLTAYAVVFLILFSALTVAVPILIAVYRLKTRKPACGTGAAVSFFFIILFFLCILYNRIHPESFLFGDCSWYWNVGDAAVENGVFSLRAYAENVDFTARSYLLPIICLAIRYLAGGNEQIAMYLYLAASSFLAALFIAVLMPKLYEELTPKKAAFLQVYGFGVIFLFFWWALASRPMTDLFFLESAVAAFLFFFRALRCGKTKNYFYCGFFLAVARHMRSNSLFLYYLVLGFLFLLWLLQLIMQEKWKPQWGAPISGRMLPALLAGVILISVPQVAINGYLGHYSLFACDEVGMYQSPNQTHAVEHLALKQTEMIQGYPLSMPNTTGEIAANKIFPEKNRKDYTLLDCAYLYLNRPIDALGAILETAFLALDVKYLDVYPAAGTITGNVFSSIRSTLVSFFNYACWTVFFLTLADRRLRSSLYRSKKEKVLFGVVLICLAGPQLLFHVEWRYFIVMYAAVYYVLAYKLLDTKFVQDNSEYMKEHCMKFGLGALVIVATMFAISVSLYARVGGIYT